jgi:transcriptional regulator with XRE-family HTH domain
MDGVIVTTRLATRRMSGRIANYLRFHRLRSGFTQAELAFLLGYQTESVISRFEGQERTISLAVGAAYQLIFGVELRNLFPALYEQIDDKLTRRMQELCERLTQNAPSTKTATKLRLLQSALTRIGSAEQLQEV